MVEARVRGRVDIDDMQFGFRSGKGAIDATFIVCQLQEKYYGIVDLEKAFDTVPKKMPWWALREVGMQRLVRVIQSMYLGATVNFKLKEGESKEFEVKVGYIRVRYLVGSFSL